MQTAIFTCPQVATALLIFETSFFFVWGSWHRVFHRLIRLPPWHQTSSRASFTSRTSPRQPFAARALLSLSDPRRHRWIPVRRLTGACFHWLPRPALLRNTRVPCPADQHAHRVLISSPRCYTVAYERVTSNFLSFFCLIFERFPRAKSRITQGSSPGSIEQSSQKPYQEAAAYLKKGASNENKANLTWKTRHCCLFSCAWENRFLPWNQLIG